MAKNAVFRPLWINSSSGTTLLVPFCPFAILSFLKMPFLKMPFIKCLHKMPSQNTLHQSAIFAKKNPSGSTKKMFLGITPNLDPRAPP